MTGGSSPKTISDQLPPPEATIGLGLRCSRFFNRRCRVLWPGVRNLDPPEALVRHGRKGRVMDKDTKHEVAVIALSTLAAIPVIGSLGFVVVASLLIW